jgi:hypothetical protein
LVKEEEEGEERRAKAMVHTPLFSYAAPLPPLALQQQKEPAPPHLHCYCCCCCCCCCCFGDGAQAPLGVPPTSRSAIRVRQENMATKSNRRRKTHARRVRQARTRRTKPARVAPIASQAKLRKKGNRFAQGAHLGQERCWEQRCQCRKIKTQ